MHKINQYYSLPRDELASKVEAEVKSAIEDSSTIGIWVFIMRNDGDHSFDVRTIGSIDTEKFGGEFVRVAQLQLMRDCGMEQMANAIESIQEESAQAALQNAPTTDTTQ
jgi:hypothetical protein